jgi:ubiquitin-activating enzyme E1
MSQSNIDEDLYSRQLYVLGHDAMKKMSQSSVLISGMGGLGVELAKNVILSGIKQVTVHDNKLTTMNDLSSQYYLSLKNIGKNRAESCYEKLSELNNYVTVNCETSELTNDILEQFNVVVLTDSILDEQIRINKFCRENDIKFI